MNSKELQKVITELEEKGIITDIVEGYGEPGYTLSKGKLGVALGDWNDVEKAVLDEINKVYDIEWGDEWTVCENRKAWRIEADSYGWLPSIVRLEDGTLITRDDIQNLSAREQYIEEYLLNNHRHADIFGLDITLKSLGFEKLAKEYATGLHRGDDDSPEKVYKSLRARYDVVFQVEAKDQFTVGWAVWVRELKQDAGEVG